MQHEHYHNRQLFRAGHGEAVSLGTLHKHELAYKQRWTTDRRGPALARGTLWHALLENHYRLIRKAEKERGVFGQGLPTADELMRANVNLLYDEGMRQDEDQELLEWMYTGYLQQYGLDPDWRIVGIEFAPEVYLPTPNGGRSRFKLKLKIDLVVRVRSTGKLWIVDHKSCRDLPQSKELDIDDQFGLYTWAMRKLGHPVFGSIHSAARTFRPKDPDKDPRPRNAAGLFLNKDGSISKQQPHVLPLDERFKRTPLYRTDEELDSIALDAYKAAKLAYSFGPGEAPRSPDPDRCGWRCDYTEACLAGRKGINEVEVLLGTGYQQDFTRH